MKNSFKILLLVAMAVLASPFQLHADEKGTTILGGLSSTALGGSVNTSIQGDMTLEVCTNVPVSYVQSLKARRQQMITRFKSVYLSNHGFGRNQQVISMQAMFNHLLATNRFSSATFSFDGFAYYDMPGALSGQYGTLLMPDMKVLRLTKKQFAKSVPVSAPQLPANPQPGIGPQTNPPSVVVDVGMELGRDTSLHNYSPPLPPTTFYPGNQLPVPPVPNRPPSPMMP
ncbi:hypothetical protein [Pedosphaera parvula]|uniref:Uncharacterized protein n=1 Tax=Pedosphaera parvula (strain Ellin514) TaxID=320771 RepID=B9XRH0_PEDPL|nr:hypothetical protein [Pedosphaera parvula]EEF57541.1 hypothetical protein Cflav_PD0591 [Pedosphaera parvula Ellin514]